MWCATLLPAAGLILITPSTHLDGYLTSLASDNLSIFKILLFGSHKAHSSEQGIEMSHPHYLRAIVLALKLDSYENDSGSTDKAYMKHSLHHHG